MNETEKFLDIYFEATKQLSQHLETSFGDLEDFREEPWNGNLEEPCWGEYHKFDDMLEFNYGEEGRFHVKKDGLCFIWMYFGTGDKGWGVFRESNIIDEDEVENEAA